LVSIVVPVFNESANLPTLWLRLKPVLGGLDRPWELVFIDDGSRDDSLGILREIAAGGEGRVRVVELARNFGQHSAILAGFRQSRGDIVVTLDADLQNPPEEIPRLIAAIDEGNDVVGGWREERHDQAYRKYASRLHNRLTSLIVGVPMHDYGCMLRAYRRHIVDTVVECDEKAAFVPALANTFAKRVAEIPVAHDDRASGESKYNLFGLVKLSLNLITGFSLIPLQMLSLAGIGISVRKKRERSGPCPRCCSFSMVGFFWRLGFLVSMSDESISRCGIARRTSCARSMEPNPLRTNHKPTSATDDQSWSP
jgi:undecaprenyl-phosphate 4-deoxy-4-formamido-L-arabinose transferase